MDDELVKYGIFVEPILKAKIFFNGCELGMLTEPVSIEKIPERRGLEGFDVDGLWKYMKGGGYDRS